MSTLTGATQQSLAQLIEQSATHSIIESLYLRFDVKPFPADASPNKLKKAMNLVRTLSARTSGPTTLMALINYLGSGAIGIEEFTRGNERSRDFYALFDRDLEASGGGSKAEEPPRAFKRPGTSSPVADLTVEPSSRRYVFVVRGRDTATYAALEEFLRSIDLRIVTWEEAARGVGSGTPLTLDIVRAGIDIADAVIVLMTPDDLGHVKPEFHDTRDHPNESRPSGQARQNVVFEAGWAIALNPSKVVLIRSGDVRPLSDIDGLNYVWLTDDVSSRRTLIGRLKNCGLEIDDNHDRWRTAGRFPVSV